MFFQGKMEESDALNLSVADSTMMKILHSAMNRSQEKINSRDGVLERLTERSKFCELAIMQLDGCLKFVRQEAHVDDDNNSVNDDDSENNSGPFLQASQQEKAITDLTEIRDRLQSRLDQTEVSIANVDRELKLLRGARRTESTLRREVSRGDQELTSLKDSVDQQVWIIKQKLEDERINISKINQGATLEEDEEEVGGGTGTVDEEEKDTATSSSLMSEINLGFEQMESDIDSLKEMFDVAFSRMRDAVYSAQLRPLEKQWRWGIEKEVIAVSINSFFSQLPHMGRSETLSSTTQEHREHAFERWCDDDFINDVVSLRQELESLYSEKALGRDAGETEMLPSQTDTDGRSRESETDPDGEGDGDGDGDGDGEGEGEGSRFVVKLIRNHESFIRRTSEDLSRLNAENLRRRSTNNRGSEVSLRTRIERVVRRLDSIVQIKNLPPIFESDKEKGEVVKEKIERSCVQAFAAEVCSDLKVGDSESEPGESLIQKLDFLLQIHDGEVGDQASIVGPSPDPKSWDGVGEGFDLEFDFGLEQRALEGLDESAFDSVSGKLKEALERLVVSRALLGELGSADPEKDCVDEHGTEQINVKDDHHQETEQIKENDDCEGDRETEQTKVNDDGDDRGTKQIKDQWSSSGSAVEDKSAAVHLELCDDFMSFPVLLSQLIVDFERALNEKIETNNTRLEEVKCKLSVLAGDVSSLKKKETAYRKAFFRRCQNLQKAEAEVDLLGDQVDDLLDLVGKIYTTLHYYAPVLEYHFEITDILKSIEKELTGAVSSS